MTPGGVLLVVLAMVGMSAANAANLVVTKSLMLAPGEHLQQPMAAVTDQGVRVQVSLGDAPAGARLVVDDAGQLFVDWRAGPDLALETRIEILLSNVDTGQMLESRDLLIQRAMKTGRAVAPPELLQESWQKSLLEPKEDYLPSGWAVDSAAEPMLIELPNQVVSAGVVVSLHVDAILPGGLIPVLQVDRLPYTASFEANGDGSRTFYWDTDNDDEGEHVFRFTAINPGDTLQRASREVMIVVGDPTRKTIRPIKQ
ncbi:hypothetical protein [Granulosicoccus antarcticus]|uniref:Uncharacterized protein n=1 Tax=Granulosicoccus antarcticus IMCC3135 TaxID=1192854 RepID=A0A2Z2NVB5_9GAMM|nr:hypothetical protein [Granulosicoccus antarcticus]ASJ75416.1 hypothetical protein IMCC3135_26805 [Granulosicoccus antarcticus IMCC3135]